MAHNGNQNVQMTPNGGFSKYTGLAPNIASLASYVLIPPFGGIAFLLLEKDNKFVRFHAYQSMLLGVTFVGSLICISILDAVLGFFWAPFSSLMEILRWVVLLGTFGFWLVCSIKSYQNQIWQIPVLGVMARKMTGE